jgi:hypothetical protein
MPTFARDAPPIATAAITSARAMGGSIAMAARVQTFRWLLEAKPRGARSRLARIRGNYETWRRRLTRREMNHRTRLDRAGAGMMLGQSTIEAVFEEAPARSFARRSAGAVGATAPRASTSHHGQCDKGRTMPAPLPRPRHELFEVVRAKSAEPGDGDGPPVGKSGKSGRQWRQL